MTTERLPVQLATRVLGVSESGYYEWRGRAPSARAIRHAWLSDVIRQVHADSRGTYGARRVRAELVLGRGISVSHGAVEMLMRRAGITGLTGRPKWRHAKPDNIARDLVNRQFSRAAPNQLWVTDITEHPTAEGKIYCCVVLDTYSRRVVGWSIDASPTAALVTNALGMAIDSRRPSPGGLIHSDQGTQGGFNWSSQHFDHGGVRWGRAGCRRRLPVLGGSGPRIGRCGRRCGHRAGRSPRVRCSGSSGG
jgi:putative transposase